MRSLVLRGLILLGGGLPWAAALAASGQGKAPRPLPPAATKKIDYTVDIQPLLRKYCLECHSAKRPRGRLRLDDREAALKGGDSGPSIVPGKSAESMLIKLAAGVNPDDVMPPEGKRMTPEEVGLLRAWVDQGVPWGKEKPGRPK